MMLIQQTKNRSTINRSRRLLWGVAFLLLTSVQVFAQIKIEAENGSFPGLSFANSPGGFSGNGFVVGFTGGPEGKELTMTSNADPGMYSVFVRYTAGLAKGYEMHVNGIPSSGMFPATGNGFGTYNAGKALVSGGQVTIKIGKGWGSYGIDYVLLTPTEARPPVKPPKQLVDVNATTSTKALFSYLVDNYGSKVLSGQAGMGEIDYVMQKTGKEPAIGGFDFIDYSISRREHVNNEDPRDTEKNIAWTKKGEGRGILTMLWHWNAPTDLVNGPDGSGKEWYKGFYKDATTFDLAAALSNKNSLRYQLIIRDIDAVAVEMKKYRDNDIPLIFRPLHEGNGNSDNPNGEGSWFWWGAKGAGPFKELWHIMHDRLTNFHQLHNLIWVYTGSLTADWYPGDQYVDAVGLDMYSPHEYDIMSANWDNALIDISSKKLLSLSESGTLPSANSIRTYANWWSWFAMWGGSYLTDRPVNELKALYADVDVITRDELPDWRAWSIGARSTVAGVIPIPGVVEAENFDNGGEGLTFHDTTPTNLIGPYRSNTGVDTEPCSEGGNNLAFSDNGEWMEYSVHVAATGTYTLDARVSSPFTTGRFHIDMDGANVTGALAVPNTSGWQTWTTVSKTVTLTAGPHIMRFVIDTKEFNTNKFTFTALSIAQSPYDQVIGLPGVVEAENFDNGGESIAYHDTEEANLGAVQRTTGPDVFTTTENSNGVGWIN
ncbi:MAG: glycosyl hydrolase, partial [Bacteroidota bacterium]